MPNFQKDPNAESTDLSTTIGRATGSAGFDENGVPIYRNRMTVILTLMRPKSIQLKYLIRRVLN